MSSRTQAATCVVNRKEDSKQKEINSVTRAKQRGVEGLLCVSEALVSYESLFQVTEHNV